MKVLVISCHPDDEIIGVGGTIYKHVQNDDIVEVLIITEASSPEWSDEYREQKKIEQEEVDTFLGINKRHHLNYPSLSLDSINRSRLNYEIYKMIEKINPDIIYTHYNNELNNSHNIVGDATLVGCRTPNKSTIYMYESEGTRSFQKSFTPNYYVQLTHSQLEKKIDAFSFYESEVKDSPHPRSFRGIRTLAKYRGDEVGVQYAEAFIQVRRLWI